MKKGFTLIELLAVIIVLAIIALIAIPNMTNILNSSKNKVDDINIINYYKAVEKAVLEQELEGTVVEGLYKIMSGTQICFDRDLDNICNESDGEISITIKATGTKVTNGTVSIDSDGNVTNITTTIDGVIYTTDGTTVNKS